MIKNDFKEGITFTVYTILALVAILMSVVTFQFPLLGSSNPLFRFLIVHHVYIMVITIFLSIGYGFFLSRIGKKQLDEEEENTQDVLKIVLNFLGSEERVVIKHLLTNNGESTQAKIAHINNMGNVKALRTVQKMNDKELVKIQKEGKVRRIILDPKIKQLLQNKEL